MSIKIEDKKSFQSYAYVLNQSAKKQVGNVNGFQMKTHGKNTFSVYVIKIF